MTYNNSVANSEAEVADLMAHYVEDAFQPLQEPDFDYTHFQRVEQEWHDSQPALNISTPSTLPNISRRVDELNPFNITWPSPFLRGQDFQDHVTITHSANPTKHQSSAFQLPNSKIYKHKKDPLPPAHKPDIPVNIDWTENTMHTLPSAIHELQKTYIPFSIIELEAAINKMKRKSPGHDSLTIDCFKHLGPGGKHKLLDLYNEIYSTGNFPQSWKHAIMVPILKKDKPAKDPASYRPISLLPVGGKILESLVLSRFNPYIHHRKLIPCIQTGFRSGMSTSINLKRMYNKSYTRSTRATHPDPTIMIFFDAKKAFDSVWDIGVLHKAMSDGLPSIIIRFLRSWLTNRTLQVRIGQTLSKTVQLKSGVPQGSVLAPTIWNYYTGDIPTTISPHSDTAVYADDTAVAATHKNIGKVHEITQKEIIQLNNWTKTRRIKFEPQKTFALAIHRNPAIRREVESLPLFLDQEKTQPLNYTKHAKFLGITFSNTGTFHHHINQTLSKCHSRVRMLKRFAGTVDPTTLYKAYRTAIEPIALYGTEVLYENLSIKVLKSFNHLEFTAIKTAFQLPRDTPIPDCLPHLKEGGISDRIVNRRDNFLERNSNSTLLRHGESTTFSQGRRLRVRTIHRDRSAKTIGWKSKLTIHQPNTFLSDMQADDPIHNTSINQLLHPENFPTASFNNPTSPPTSPDVILLPKFNIKPEHSRREPFIPSTSVICNILRRARERTRNSRDPSANQSCCVPTPVPLDGTSRDQNFDPG